VLPHPAVDLKRSQYSHPSAVRARPVAAGLRSVRPESSAALRTEDGRNGAGSSFDPPFKSPEISGHPDTSPVEPGRPFHLRPSQAPRTALELPPFEQLLSDDMFDTLGGVLHSLDRLSGVGAAV
jgi:hypothetical protein